MKLTVESKVGIYSARHQRLVNVQAGRTLREQAVSDKPRTQGFNLPREIVGRAIFDMIARQAKQRPEALALCATSIFGARDYRLSYGTSGNEQQAHDSAIEPMEQG